MAPAIAETKPAVMNNTQAMASSGRVTFLDGIFGFISFSGMVEVTGQS